MNKTMNAMCLVVMMMMTTTMTMINSDDEYIDCSRYVEHEDGSAYMLIK